MVYGEPRATLDIDVVVTLDARAAERIVESFPAPEFYPSAERVAAVAQRGGTFNAIDLARLEALVRKCHLEDAWREVRGE